MAGAPTRAQRQPAPDRANRRKPGLYRLRASTHRVDGWAKNGPTGRRIGRPDAGIASLPGRVRVFRMSSTAPGARCASRACNSWAGRAGRAGDHGPCAPKSCAPQDLGRAFARGVTAGTRRGHEPPLRPREGRKRPGLNWGGGSVAWGSSGPVSRRAGASQLSVQKPGSPGQTGCADRGLHLSCPAKLRPGSLPN